MCSCQSHPPRLFTCEWRRARCVKCAAHRGSPCSPCPAQHQVDKLCDGLPDGTGPAMHVMKSAHQSMRAGSIWYRVLTIVRLVEDLQGRGYALCALGQTNETASRILTIFNWISEHPNLLHLTKFQCHHRHSGRNSLLDMIFPFLDYIHKSNIRQNRRTHILFLQN